MQFIIGRVLLRSVAVLLLGSIAVLIQFAATYLQKENKTFHTTTQRNRREHLAYKGVLQIE